MNNLIISSLFISIIYCFIKFLEIRLVSNTQLNIKDLIRDSIFVFLASSISNFIINKYNILQLVGNSKEIPAVFTSEPGF